MKRWEFDRVLPGFDLRLERVAQELGLRSKRFVLKSLPANVHWHFGIKGATGTLEGTWLIDSEQAWLVVRANRHADWVDAAANALVQRLSELDPPPRPWDGELPRRRRDRE